MQDDSREPPVLPQGPGSKKKLLSREWRLAIAALIVALVVVAAFGIRLSFLVEFVPGPAQDVESKLQISGARTFSSAGKLIFTTVSIDTNVTLVDWFRSNFDPNRTVISLSDYTGGQPLSKVASEAKLQMTQSQRHAQEVALSRLGYGHPTGDGARIVAVVQGEPAAGVLQVGDKLLAVDSKPVDTTCDVGRDIGNLDVGQRTTITVSRKGAKKQVSLNTADNPTNPGEAFLGVAMKDIHYHFDPKVDVTFDIENVGGPSAGMMFALTLYDELTPGDLTGGRVIAGTGEISCDGDVAPIGGVEEKVAGAAAAGADTFLAPAADYAAAKKAAPEGLHVVSVSSFGDALSYLKGLGSQ